MTQYGGREMANAFRTVRRNTVQIAHDIPEDKYDFVPAPGTRSVRQLLGHMAFSNYMHYDFHRDKRVTTLVGYDFPALHVRTRDLALEPRTKAELIATLEEEGEKFASWLESLSNDFLFETYTDTMGQNPKTRFENLLGAKEHEMHHRGQLMLVERMLGITPHLTRQMEERARARAAAQRA